MKHLRAQLGVLFAASLLIAVTTASSKGVLYVPAVVVMVLAGVGVTALVITRGGTS
jgi:hypothetical protein